jgi:Sulfatase
MKALPSYPWRAVHLVAVWSYAVSQPVFSMLEANPELLVVRGSSRLDVVVFATVLVLAPPMLALAVELVLRLASRVAADVLHLAFLGVFVLPLGLHLLKRLEPGAAAAVLGAALVALLAIFLYSRFTAVRLFLTFSAALPLVGFLLFVWQVPVATASNSPSANVTVGRAVPVVLVVFDELPVSSLLDSKGRIDAVRYPSFARLARDGTWYANATTPHVATTKAVPAILDGNLPRAGSLPTARDHPRNLFATLADSYDLRVAEHLTHLCLRTHCPSVEPASLPRRLPGLFSDVRVGYLYRVLPASLTGSLPRIDQGWTGFGEDDHAEAIKQDFGMFAAKGRQDIGDFASSEHGEAARTLHFLHLVMPHSPWRFLPSGREYGNGWAIDGLDNAWRTWDENESLVQHGYQRHLLQVGYTDRLLGRILDRLEAAGTHEKALVVVTADHGASFVAGKAHRFATRENMADIARVPMFVKYPHQRSGAVDRGVARTIDIFPTILDVLDVKPRWAVDGRSLVEPRPRATEVTVLGPDDKPVTAPIAEVARSMARTLRRKHAWFGEGHDSLYELGESTKLLARGIEEVDVRGRSAGAGARFDGAHEFAAVRLESSSLPSRVTGTIDGTEIGREVELAVAVNGRIAALTRCFRRDGQQRFSALVPESSFSEGRNVVELFAVEGTRSKPWLVKLGESSSSESR